MRAVLQRVKEASVTVEGKMISEIGHGFLILLGIEAEDTIEDIQWLTRKIVNMRVFADKEDAMNLSIMDTAGNCLVVSQFTLHASTRKGNRPSFIKAARPEVAIPLYKEFISALEKEIGKPVRSGSFGAMMDVQLVNDGPVTILIDSKKKE
jgi:D-tyrosyl-tRNA(Tyr) deacylase